MAVLVVVADGIVPATPITLLYAETHGWQALIDSLREMGR